MNAAAATNSFAEQQLAKYGWKRGQGLGKHREGVKRAITVSRRTDNRGIGSDSSQWNSNWWDHLYNKASSSSSGSASPAPTDTQKKEAAQTDDDGDREENEYRFRISSAAGERDTLGDYDGMFVRAVTTSVSTVKVIPAEIQQQQQQQPNITSRVDRTQLTRDSSIHLGSTGISDAELFAACEGRMARKGARAEQSGKLARVLGDGMPRPEVAARIEAALSGRLHELEEKSVSEPTAIVSKKRKRLQASDNGTKSGLKKKEKRSKSKGKSKSKSGSKDKSKSKKKSKRTKESKDL
ncbi:hypothetical protein GGI11_001560 [Coemansia sp. RSA 2049]|nr:hypothetical protein GGI11_001560 [Coemansia sp. RSA 2049]